MYCASQIVGMQQMLTDMNCSNKLIKLKCNWISNNHIVNKYLENVWDKEIDRIVKDVRGKWRFEEVLKSESFLDGSRGETVVEPATIPFYAAIALLLLYAAIALLFWKRVCLMSFLFSWSTIKFKAILCEIVTIMFVCLWVCERDREETEA